MVTDNPTIIRLGGTRYRRQYHTIPCQYCDSASPWHIAYKTCPVHSILPCTCKDLDRTKSYRHYCEKCGWAIQEIKREMRRCNDCKKETLHKLTSRIFIGADGGVGGHECLTCGHEAWYI